MNYDPNYARAWAALGAVYDLKGSFLSIPELSHKAIELEKKAIEIKSETFARLSMAGRRLQQFRPFDEGIEAIKEAMRLEPNNAGAHASLGARLLDRQGDDR